MREAAWPPAAGFVLAGGLSTRMGRDKALLPAGGQRTLIEHIAGQVRSAAGNVSIVAGPERYARFGIPVIADIRPGCGPLGGIATALAVSGQPWNLIVACDMPEIDAPFLTRLLDAAISEAGDYDCLAPIGPRGPEPLCAVYHRRSLAKLEDALDRNILKMKLVLRLLDTRLLPVSRARALRNVNTPEDWAAHE